MVFIILCQAALTAAACADTLSWATRPLVSINGASDVATVNGVNITTTGSTAGAFTANQIQIQPAGTSNGTTGYIFSSMNATVDNETARQTVTITFSEPVYNVSFTVWDLDGGPNFNDGTNFFNDIMTFTSSAGLPTTGTPAAQVTWTAATGRAAATANGGLANANGNITVTFAGPVTSLTINHIAGAVTGSNNPTQQAVLIEDITFFKRPQLTLVKTVTNDNGGTSAVSAFPLTASGPSTITGVSGSAAVTSAVLTPGTYALSESGPSGYTASAWSCTAGTLAGVNLTLAAGQVATCTINNNDVAPRLTLVKTVINDNGGTAATSAFTLSAAGPASISGVSGAASVTNATVNAGTYALSESAVAGYAASAWSCTAGTLVGSNLTLAVGQAATCTINNNDIAPRLTLLKTVTNDNGGTNVDTDFTLTATGPTNITGIEGAASVTNAAVNAGTYVLSESGAAAAAYNQGIWSCTAGTLTGNSLALTVGQTASCTITNNDKPRLTLLKTVINNSGGTALDTAFTLTAAGPVTISGVEGAAAVTNANVNAGTYALSESSLAGYTGGAWSCVGGTLAGSNITLTQAQNATCTVTNDDQSATLTLSKTIVNTGGGTDALADFPLTAAGPTSITGVSGAAAVTGAAVSAGAYALSEATNSDYTASAWSCTGGSLSGSALTLTLGETANCSITNTFVPAPALTIEKTADTAGPLVAGQTVTYTYLVQNTGNVSISGVNVAEIAFNGSGTPPGPVAGGPTTIAPGQTVTFTALYVVTQQDVDTLQ